uniref:SUN domain-containing protein n=1 Tax=Anopheles dirus TaxID=7168 RepID=A0A182NBA8_9DIPT
MLFVVHIERIHCRLFVKKKLREDIVMAIEHQKNLSVYIMGVLLVTIAILQVYLSENFSTQQNRKINLIEKNCGTCYAMEGSSGMVVLKLTKNVFLNGITIEHIPMSSLPAGQDEYSAMKEFSVWGTNDLGGEGINIYLGTFTFDYTKTFLKTFALNWDSKMPSVRYVGVEILSNYGKYYTCIYR